MWHDCTPETQFGAHCRDVKRDGNWFVFPTQGREVIWHRPKIKTPATALAVSTIYGGMVKIKFKKQYWLGPVVRSVPADEITIPARA